MTVSGWGIDQQTSETDFSVATILYKAMVLGYTSSDCCGVGFFSNLLGLYSLHLSLKSALNIKFRLFGALMRTCILFHIDSFKKAYSKQLWLHEFPNETFDIWNL